MFFIHSSLYRALNLIFIWGGISQYSIIKTKMGIGSMGAAAGVLTSAMFKSDATPFCDYSSGLKIMVLFCLSHSIGFVDSEMVNETNFCLKAPSTFRTVCFQWWIRPLLVVFPFNSFFFSSLAICLDLKIVVLSLIVYLQKLLSIALDS